MPVVALPPVPVPTTLASGSSTGLSAPACAARTSLAASAGLMLPTFAGNGIAASCGAVILRCTALLLGAAGLKLTSFMVTQGG